MGVGYGQIGHIRVNEQDSFNTVDTASLTAVPIINETITETIEQLVEQGMRARHMAGPTHEGVRASAGAVRMEPLPAQLGVFLRAAVGQSSISFVNSAIEHTFLPLVSTDFMDKSAMPPMTIVIHRDVGSADAYADMNINGLTFEMANSQLLALNVDYVGGVRQGIAATAPTYPAGLPWAWDQASMTIGGIAIDEFRSLTWNHVNNLEAIWTMGNSKTPQRVRRNNFVEVTAEATIVMNTAVHSHLFSLFDQQLESQLLINFNGITSPGSLLFDMPLARITGYSWNIAGPQQIEAELSIMAKFDETSNYICKYLLTNCTPAYE